MEISSEKILILQLSKCMTILENTLKTLVILFTRNQKIIKIEVDSLLNKKEYHGDISVINKDIYQQLLKYMLISAYSKISVNNCKYISTMCSIILLDHISNPQCSSHYILKLLYPELLIEKNENTIETMEEIYNYLNSTALNYVRANEENKNLLNFVNISMIRALISNARIETLLTPIALSDKNKNKDPTLFSYCLNKTIYYCEKSVEASMKIVAFESMKKWIEKTMECYNMKEKDIYTTICQNLDNYTSKSMCNKFMQFILNNWSDPVDTIQQKVEAILEVLLNLISSKSKYNKNPEFYNEMTHDIYDKLLKLDYFNKTRYGLLSVVVPFTGTNQCLSIQPDIISLSVKVFRMDTMARVVNHFIAIFYGCQIKDKTDEEKKNIFNTYYAEPLCDAITSSNEILRKNANTYLLTTLLKCNKDVFGQTIETLKSDSYNKHENYLSAILATIRTASHVIGNRNKSSDINNEGKLFGGIDKKLLLQCFNMNSLNIRIDAFGLICENAKEFEFPTKIELELFREFLPLNMHCAIPEFRQKIESCANRFLSRLRNGILANWKDIKKIEKKKKINDDLIKKKENLMDQINYAEQWLNELLEFCFQSIYPDASYQRGSIGLHLIEILINIFGITEISLPSGFDIRKSTLNKDIFPFKLPIITERNVKILISAINIPYDTTRQSILNIFNKTEPNQPLPGIDTVEKLEELLSYVLLKLNSPRTQDNDGAVLLGKILTKKYVNQLNWDVKLITKDEINIDQNVKGEAVFIRFIRRIIPMIDEQIKIAKKNLLYAAKRYPIFGLFNFLNDFLINLDYNKYMKDHIEELREVHKEIYERIIKANEVVLDIIQNSSPEGPMPDIQDISVSIDEIVNEFDEGVDASQKGKNFNVTLNCCWRVIKSTSQVLSTILTKAPIQKSDDDKNYILSYDQLIEGSNLYRTYLSTIRHYGAIIAIYPGYIQLCKKLLNSSQEIFSSLPQKWLEDSLNTIKMSNKISITRRSAGMPFLILAILLSEQNSNKVLLPHALSVLIDIARQPFDTETYNEKCDLPQVHAMNILRSIFRESKLSDDISAYVTDTMILTLEGFKSPAWSIRNCAMMMFTTILHRIIGSKKTRDDFNSVNFITRSVFVSRYHNLYIYLSKILNEASALMEKNSSHVQQELFAILVLLSRLQPNTKKSDIETEDDKDLTSVIKSLRSFAKCSIYQVREAAARSLVPMVSNHDINKYCIDLINDYWTLSNQNGLHGSIIQMKYLLKTHLIISSYEMKKDFVDNVLSMIMERINLANKDYNKCELTRAEYINLLNEILFNEEWINESISESKDSNENSQNSNKEIISYIRTKCSFYRKIAFEMIKNILFNEYEYSQIMGTWYFREHCTKIVMKALISYSELINSSENLLEKLIKDPQFEVRQYTLQSLINYLNETTIESDKRNEKLEEFLKHIIEEIIKLEDNKHECLSLKIKIIPKLLNNPLLGYEITPEKLCDLLNKLNTIINITYKNHLSVIIESIITYGFVFNNIYKNKEKIQNDDYILNMMKAWFDIINRYNDDNSTESGALHHSICSSIAYMDSLLSTDIPKSLEVYIMKIYFILIDYLQDDESDIRDAVTEIVSKNILHQNYVMSETKALISLYEKMNDNFKDRDDYQLTLKKNLFYFDVDIIDQFIINKIKPIKKSFFLERPDIYKELLINVQNIIKYITPTSEDIQKVIPIFKKLDNTLHDIFNEFDSSQLYQTISDRDIFVMTYSILIWLEKCLQSTECSEKDILSIHEIISNWNNSYIESFHALLIEIIMSIKTIIDKKLSKPISSISDNNALKFNYVDRFFLN
ncbi:hypothetical protein BCR32DRAFT_273100 [Anaeromyces robustus]|uniref:Uncharacterized protein n=1 Tax=Anaeromyces robustus TaxID=1754192 RepID=A0A1Y1VUN3_9FUNG|nr:hypothetical protein BCR32DRAFT_273100 [Anaeromyces robustus]|eukprot:ORX64464.1 hypothetical protein BCR32DRAFT_273100 [Anaeromyces robustus]